jgi:formamidopyrimidine-DNA glycosylase
MPELPEVETIRKDLLENIKSNKIKDIFISPKAKINKTKKFFSNFLINKKVKNIDRIGKLIIFDFNEKYFLLIHLKMTGQLIFKNNKKIIGGGHSEKKIDFDLPNSSTRIIITFGNNSKLFFNDTRRFGYFKLVDKKELEKEKSKFGLEPLQANFIYKDFKKLFENKKTNLKAFLLNQKNIAGLGNIYTDEVCFEAVERFN